MKQTYDPGQKAYNELTDIYAIIDPSRIRSRFAAFDPARSKEADLLAGIGAIGAGLLSSEALELNVKKKGGAVKPRTSDFEGMNFYDILFSR